MLRFSFIYIFVLIGKVIKNSQKLIAKVYLPNFGRNGLKIEIAPGRTTLTTIAEHFAIWNYMWWTEYAK